MTAAYRAGKIYRRLIEAIPAAQLELLDSPVTNRRALRADRREAARWAARLTVPSRWYATDGTHMFYLFRKKALKFSDASMAFARLPVTLYGTDAETIYRKHGGQLTDRRPAGWISLATLTAVNYGGLDGGPRDWGMRDNEDLDLYVDEVERLRAGSRLPQMTGPLREFADLVARHTRH